MQTAIASPAQTYWQWRGQAIHYVQSGGQSGATDDNSHPPLLLVHGFGASTDHWKKNIAGLSDQFEVWAIDLLGFGRSQKPDWEYSGDLWRDQLHEFIQTVIGRPVVLAGNSLGGYASLCVAAAYPESVAGVILLNSAGPFSGATATKPNPLAAVVGRLVRSVLLQPGPNWLLFQYSRRRSVIRKTLAKVYVDQTAVTDELVEDIYRPSCDVGAPQVFASVFKTARGANVDELLGQMRSPLMLLWGEGDPWIKARSRSARFRHYYPRLTEHFLQAGHCPHDEVPEQVNALMRQWIVAGMPDGEGSAES